MLYTPKHARAQVDEAMDAPLKGIRVIDWTIWQQGPVAGVMLADLGAEVIKLEERESGDPARWILAVAGGSTYKAARNWYFEANNRHKKSLALDLKKPEALEVVYKLAAKSDVFIQNFRQGVAHRLGLDYAALSARNPRLIYANASGYGPLGAESGDPSFDYLGQARSGIMNAIGGPDQPPTYITGGVADQAGAIMLAFGVITALLARERQGVGQELDVSHLGSMTMLQGLNVASRAMMGWEIPRNAREAAFNPLWNHYQCGDGKWLCLSMLQSDRYWKDFCIALGLPELVADPRFAELRERGRNAREVIAILDRTFAAKPREEWLKILRAGGDFIFGIVNAVADLPNDPQVIANEYIADYEHPALGKTKVVGVPIKFSRTPGSPRGAAPELGEHTEILLTEELGYSWEEVARLREAGVI
jgi:crotonobetainyl-CoA:carnitine CoA-transferase CaiB-like acyl-CoA transferase